MKYWTCFPQFRGLQARSLEEILTLKQRYEQYFERYSEICMIFYYEIIAKNHFLHYPQEMLNQIVDFRNKQLYDQVMFSRDTTALPNGLLKQFLDESFVLSLQKKIQEQPNVMQQCSLTFDCDEQKQFQSIILGNFIRKRVQEESSPVTLVDIGAGKAYTSAHLAFDRDLKVVAVEASEKHAVSLQRRMFILMKHLFKKDYDKYVNPKYFGYDEDASFAESKLDNLRFAIQYFEKDTDLPTLLRQSLNVKQFHNSYKGVQIADVRENQRVGIQVQGKIGVAQHVQDRPATFPESFLLFCLHGCGDLSVNILRKIQEPSVKQIVTVPCCFQHLTQTSISQQFGHPLFQTIEKAITLDYLKAQYFPNLPKHLFSAMGEIEFMIYQRQIDEFRTRSLLMQCGEDHNEMFKKLKSFEAASAFVIAKSMRNTQFVKQHQQQLTAFQLLCLLRQVYSLVFESFLLLDRLVLCAEQFGDMDIEVGIQSCLHGFAGCGFVIVAKKF